MRNNVEIMSLIMIYVKTNHTLVSAYFYCICSFYSNMLLSCHEKKIVCLNKKLFFKHKYYFTF